MGVSYISLQAEGDPKVLTLDRHGQILEHIHSLLERTFMSPIPVNLKTGEERVLGMDLVSLVLEAGLIAPVPGQRGHCRYQVEHSSWWVGVGAEAASCASPPV